MGKGLEAYRNARSKGRKRRARREGDDIKFVDVRFERKQIVGMREGRDRKGIP